jgi:hypothetical protein
MHIMRSKKLIALMVAPLFAVGMAACETDRTDDDVWETEEGQLPAYETQPDPYADPAYQMDRDTLLLPEGHPEGTDPTLRTDPEMEPQPETQPQY